MYKEESGVVALICLTRVLLGCGQPRFVFDSGRSHHQSKRYRQFMLDACRTGKLPKDMPFLNESEITY